MDETSTRLLKEAAAGDATARNKLAAIYQPFIEAIAAFCRVRNHADVEDIAQNTLVAMFRELPDFRRERAGSLRAWLRTVTKRMAGHLQRQAKRSLGADLASVNELQIMDDPGFDEFIRRMDVRDVVKSIWAVARQEFSEQYVRIFEESVLRGRDTDDVAREFGVKPSFVHTVRSRVLKRCRALGTDLYGADPFGEAI